MYFPYENNAVFWSLISQLGQSKKKKKKKKNKKEQKEAPGIGHAIVEEKVQE